MICRALVWLVLTLAPIIAQAGAPSCLPSNLGGTGSVWVGNTNAAGLWAGWWCSSTEFYVAACTRAMCLGNVTAHRLALLWLRYPSLDDLFFGSDPRTDPTLRAVWTPDSALLDAVRPK